MTVARDIPSLVGYSSADAEIAATDYGVEIVWIDAEPPRWLHAHHEARVGRQRQREDGRLELLRVLIPSLPAKEDAIT